MAFAVTRVTGVAGLCDKEWTESFGRRECTAEFGVATQKKCVLRRGESGDWTFENGIVAGRVGEERLAASGDCYGQGDGETAP
jgi:hypothetical protein